MNKEEITEYVLELKDKLMVMAVEDVSDEVVNNYMKKCLDELHAKSSEDFEWVEKLFMKVFSLGELRTKLSDYEN